MRVTSKRGERMIELDARERRVLTEAVAVLRDLGQLVDDAAAAELADGIQGVLEAYPAKERAKVAK